MDSNAESNEKMTESNGKGRESNSIHPDPFTDGNGIGDLSNEKSAEFVVQEHYLHGIREDEVSDAPKWKQKWWDFTDTIADAFYRRMRSYYWLHLLTWMFASLVWSGFVAASGASKNMPYIDSLFYSVSAMCATGLATRDLSTETLATKILIFFAMLPSGAVFESSIPVFHRFYRLRKLKKSPIVNDTALETLKQETVTAQILCGIIWSYWFLVQLVSYIALGFWTQFSGDGSAVMDTGNVNAWWWTTFQVVSSFNNCGFALLFNSVMQFSKQILVLAFCGMLILMGNTAYPVFLRASIVLLEKATAKRFPYVSQTSRFLLENPRAHMTHLFPKSQTWWLVITLLIFNFSQAILMIALDNSTTAFAGLGSGYTVANAAFQSISVRTAGLNSINIADLKAESLVFMILMMYVSAFPVTILLRSTNESESERRKVFGGSETTYQLSRLLVNDLLWIVIGWYLICAFQGYTSFADGAFQVLFEMVSAYGTVGLSLGLMCCPYSFCGSFNIPSKLVIIATMLLGRHRGMPDNIDSAIQLDYSDSAHVPIQHRPSTALGRVSTASKRSGVLYPEDEL